MVFHFVCLCAIFNPFSLFLVASFTFFIYSFLSSLVFMSWQGCSSLSAFVIKKTLSIFGWCSLVIFLFHFYPASFYKKSLLFSCCQEKNLEVTCYLLQQLDKSGVLDCAKYRDKRRRLCKTRSWFPEREKCTWVLTSDLARLKKSQL